MWDDFCWGTGELSIRTCGRGVGLLLSGPRPEGDIHHDMWCGSPPANCLIRSTILCTRHCQQAQSHYLRESFILQIADKPPLALNRFVLFLVTLSVCTSYKLRSVEWDIIGWLWSEFGGMRKYWWLRCHRGTSLEVPGNTQYSRFATRFQTKHHSNASHTHHSHFNKFGPLRNPLSTRMLPNTTL